MRALANALGQPVSHFEVQCLDAHHRDRVFPVAFIGLNVWLASEARWTTWNGERWVLAGLVE